jgi:dihydrodipicolinate synthase/N-acetylneuraminate lyase/heme-degrading monooxygenase HmoA
MTVVSVLSLDVRPGAEDELVRAFAELAVFDHARRSGGFRGGRLLRPAAGGEPFLVVAEWDDADAYRGWLDNPVRAELAARLDALVAGPPQAGFVYSDVSLAHVAERPAPATLAASGRDSGRAERKLRGAFAASLTPLRDGGNALDEAAIGPLVDFLVTGGVDGVLALGTTGEGILFSQRERRVAARGYVAAAAGRVPVIVHCGAQTTAETVALAADAAEGGAAAVAVIGPPYFPLDERALLEHFTAAAAACAPLPFFVYEFAARSGYDVPPTVIERLRDRAPNLAGLKVSDTPWERFEPYLIEGLDVFVGPEALIHRGIDRGAVGAVSGLPPTVTQAVARLVEAPTAEAAAELGRLRATVQSFPFHAAQKFIVARRGVPVLEDVRAPLRGLDDSERAELAALVDRLDGRPGSRGRPLAETDARSHAARAGDLSGGSR